ncbi:ArfGap-domain-containing protein [Karstenula rhodostoma CBS 690.94]|uniref:ArfGap-domain-containing protein n=1 Tax=Karstenula rhodostoma CBS 690.94 TaxID=1392251 RepID=A0A9P4U7S3_9PLEO|nr:ArfGap-domain-containing protein [Karstenula rhodostoma CBS 690.94]
MSRRPNPAADRAEQNRQTLKSLVKIEANKSCADCKRNKHPRWASWNLGIFVCIRCSGIHRGMGTHISKVKSVDLDTWTDEQLQSVLKWGNARANKYWEAKLAPGHVPSETKMENFIRTKYESKRWVMDGPMPDPASLDVEDDDMPLKKVQEKVQIERSASQRLGGPSSRTPPPPRAVAPPQPSIDLFGDETPAPPRASTGPPQARAVPPKAEPAPPKQTKAGDSLLGLDFLGSASAQPARPSSTGPAAAAAPSRPDLKQSILSLYAAKPAAPPQPQQHARQDSFGGLASPSQQSPQQQQSSYGGLNDAFSSLSFGAPAAPAPKPSPFSGLDSFTSSRSPPSTSSNMFGGGGNFFDSAPKSPPIRQTPAQKPASSNYSAFSSAPAPAQSNSGLNDLLDLSMPAPAPVPQPPVQSMASPSLPSSAFNLSQPAAPKPAPAPAPAAAFSGFSNMDAWGSTDAWASPAPPQTQSSHLTSTHAAPQSQPKSPGWGAPNVTQDDDFGGWSSAAPVAGTSSTTSHQGAAQSKPAGGFGGDDLFSNVWE